MISFVISLKSTPDRLHNFRANNPHIYSEHFEAVHGIHLNENDLINNNLISNNCKYSKSAMGCAFSHVKLWDMCLRMNEPITIFEDDAIIHRSFDLHLNNAIFDRGMEFILWGWNFDAPLIINYNNFFKNTILKWTEIDSDINAESYQKTQINAGFTDLICAFGTVAYTITPNAARKLLQSTLPLRNRLSTIPELKSLENVGVDISMSFDYQNIGAKVCIPPMVITPNDKKTSTVNPRS